MVDFAMLCQQLEGFLDDTSIPEVLEAVAFVFRNKANRPDIGDAFKIALRIASTRLYGLADNLYGEV